tara:strand:+ start:21 stop:263 length:243 start_codon:yes stop_codon:yes gene_type:complete
MDSKTVDETLVGIVMRQTSYSHDEAVERLLFYNNDHIQTIKTFLNIPGKAEDKKASLNQEIYRQFRRTLEIEECNKPKLT